MAKFYSNLINILLILLLLLLSYAAPTPCLFTPRLSSLPWLHPHDHPPNTHTVVPTHPTFHWTPQQFSFQKNVLSLLRSHWRWLFLLPVPHAWTTIHFSWPTTCCSAAVRYHLCELSCTRSWCKKTSITSFNSSKISTSKNCMFLIWKSLSCVCVVPPVLVYILCGFSIRPHKIFITTAQQSYILVNEPFSTVYFFFYNNI